ncbi:MAG: flavodoxin family protein [Leptolyngbya sp. SIO1D8]|nr:flavodoxin family protein [Leptolyngbya sp. SIO1D8]
MNVLAISSSPRRNGNSFLLAEATLKGVREAGHTTDLVYLDDYLKGFLRDCRQCRNTEGHCTINDNFATLLQDKFLTADAVIFATPLYWYGISGQLKTFFDRIFCYIAASYPAASEVVDRLCGKRIALMLSSEESYVGAPLGVLHEIQEYARYTHSNFIGVVQGFGNRRGDVLQDPSEPINRAYDFGKHLFDIQITDYRIDTPRTGSVWKSVD